MKKIITLSCLLALSIIPTQANANCIVDISSDYWNKQIKTDSVEFDCKALICGGSGYKLRFGDNSVEGETNLKTVDKNKLPLSFDDLNGERTTRSHLRQYTINETYFGALRTLGFQSEGVLETQVMKNLNFLKASAQCG